MVSIIGVQTFVIERFHCTSGLSLNSNPCVPVNVVIILVPVIFGV